MSVAREIAHAERAHRHPELLERASTCAGDAPSSTQEHRLAQVLLQHPVADEPVADAGHHRGLADALGSCITVCSTSGGRVRAAHDFEQLHHVRAG
jgi:hypothetical protein